MKKTIYSLMLLMACTLSFSACSNDDDNKVKEDIRPGGTYNWYDGDGDWNDPANPHYATYKGKYNPIKGVWRRQNNNTYIEGEYFTDDFKIRRVTFWNGTYNIISGIGADSYQVNDKAFKNSDMIYIYMIEDNGKTMKAYYVDNNYKIRTTPTIYTWVAAE